MPFWSVVGVKSLLSCTFLPSLQVVDGCVSILICRYVLVAITKHGNRLIIARYDDEALVVLSVEHVISIRVLGGFPFPRSQLLFVAYCNESFVTFLIPFIKIMLYICKQY